MAADADCTRRVTLVGDDARSGAYVLWLHVVRDLAMPFGRFRGGVRVPVPAGAYAYVGSAMGGMAPRLLRHASRSQGAPQAIRRELLVCFAGLGLVRAGVEAMPKTLRWHVDYLLEETAVALTDVLVICSRAPLEARLAQLLLAHPGMTPLASGLGASDFPGRTHLLRVGKTAVGMDARSDTSWQAVVAYLLKNLLGDDA